MTSDGLSDRAQGVLDLLNAGKNPTQIGAELGITSQAVHGHMRRLRDRGLIPGAKPAANGHAEVSVAGAFAEVKQSIARQTRELEKLIPTIEAKVEQLQEQIKALRKEKADAEKAIERLAKLKETVV